MDARKYLQLTRDILIKEYSSLVRELILHKDRPVLKVVFYDEIILYVRYNNYGEYTYCVIFSPNPDDQMRFDNYDDRWDVKTRPHHFHIRGMESVIDSPMIGDPKKDIPILIQNILIYRKK